HPGVYYENHSPHPQALLAAPQRAAFLGSLGRLRAQLDALLDPLLPPGCSREQAVAAARTSYRQQEAQRVAARDAEQKEWGRRGQRLNAAAGGDAERRQQGAVAVSSKLLQQPDDPQGGGDFVAAIQAVRVPKKDHRGAMAFVKQEGISGETMREEIGQWWRW